jgi:hypothetical protein
MLFAGAERQENPTYNRPVDNGLSQCNQVNWIARSSAQVKINKPTALPLMWSQGLRILTIV